MGNHGGNGAIAGYVDHRPAHVQNAVYRENQGDPSGIESHAFQNDDHQTSPALGTCGRTDGGEGGGDHNHRLLGQGSGRPCEIGRARPLQLPGKERFRPC